MDRVMEAIPSIVRQLDDNTAANQALIFAAWIRCAGEQLSRRAIPAEFAGGVLTVSVADQIWQRHLGQLSSELCGRINSLLGQRLVKRIEFQLAHAGATTELSDQPPSETKERHEDVSPAITKASLAISDIELREHFLAAAAAYLSRSGK